MTEEYLTTKEAAEYIGVNENTLAAWRVRRKNLRFSYFGRNVRYKKSVLDLYLKTRNLLQQEKEVFPKEEQND